MGNFSEKAKPFPDINQGGALLAINSKTLYTQKSMG